MLDVVSSEEHMDFYDIFNTLGIFMGVIMGFGKFSTIINQSLCVPSLEYSLSSSVILYYEQQFISDN